MCLGKSKRKAVNPNTLLGISSSGHLAIAEHLLGMSGASEIPEFFDVLLHLGTLIAVFAAYWDDIRDMVVEFFCGASDLIRHSTPTPVPPARRMIIPTALPRRRRMLCFAHP